MKHAPPPPPYRHIRAHTHTFTWSRLETAGSDREKVNLELWFDGRSSLSVSHRERVTCRQRDQREKWRSINSSNHVHMQFKQSLLTWCKAVNFLSGDPPADRHSEQLNSPANGHSSPVNQQTVYFLLLQWRRHAAASLFWVVTVCKCVY